MKAAEVRDLLQGIYDRSGYLTPELVVEAARPKDSPLHKAIFDRSPNEAAEAWYRERAGELIRKVKIKSVRDDDSVPADVRAYYSVHDSNRGFIYEPAEKVAQDPFLRQLVLRDMEREFKSLERKYVEFEEWSALLTASLKQVG